MAKQKLSVAMIGCGFMGRAHSNAFRQAGMLLRPSLRTQAQSRLRPPAGDRGEVCRPLGLEEAQTDWQSVVTRKDIDVVDIGAPNHLHAPIAIEAAKAGRFCSAKSRWP